MRISSNENIKRKEANTKHASYIPESSSDILYNSIVKIQIDEKFGTGFLMKAQINTIQMNLLLTCNHVITQTHISEKAIIISYGKINKETTKKFKLDSNARYIKTFESPIDITLIESHRRW